MCGVGRSHWAWSHGAPSNPLLALSSKACFGVDLGPLHLEPHVPFSHGSNSTNTVPFSCALSNVKKVSLELGGKSPLIIFADCDLSKAVQMVRASLGQVIGGGEVGYFL